MAGELQGTADGTLTPEGVLSRYQALQAVHDEELRRKTAEAAQAASGAAQAYGQAAAAPPPELSLGAQFIPTLLSGLASVISQNPSYQKNAREQIAQQKEDLFKARAQNLQSLRDVYMQKADQAQKQGDLETDLKYKEKIHTLDKTMEAVLEKQSQQGLMNRQNQAQQAANERARILADSRKQAAGVLQSARQSAAIGRLSDDVRQDLDIKDFGVIRDQLTTGLDAVKANNSAGDIILMRALARATDPRTGVREEEYRTFKGAQGALLTLGVGMTKGMIGKGQLTAGGRQALLSRLRTLYARKGEQKDRSVALFKRRAGAEGIDPTLVLKPYEIGVDPKAKAQAMTAAREGDDATLQRLLDDFPDLNDDPELEAVVENK